MKYSFLALCIITLTGIQPLKAQPGYTLSNYQSYRFSGSRLTIKAVNGYLVVEPYTEQCIRVTYKNKPDEEVVSYSTIGQSSHPRTVVSQTPSAIKLSTGKVDVLISKANLTVSFNNKTGNVTEDLGYTVKDTAKSISFKLDNQEAIYGGGSKGVNFNRRGLALQNYNQAHYGYQFGQANLNISVPLLISNRLYALYFDNFGRGNFDIGKTDQNRLTFSTSSGLMSFFFISGSSFDQLLNQYTNLTGKQPLPPRWALGFIQSRYGYRSWKQVNNVVDSTQKAGIPLDAMVLDLFWYGNDRVMGNHNFDPERFPDPAKSMSDLRAKGIKIIPISETFITEKSENFKAAKEQGLLTRKGETDKPYIVRDFWAGPAALLDIFRPQAQQFYWDFYRARIKDGVAGWWFDLGEPETHPDSMRHVNGMAGTVHNVYALTWARTLFDGYRKEFPQQRVFNLIRSGYAGMQRYSVFPWSGDISRTFQGYKAQIPIMMGMGFSGVAYTHFDAGGFTGDVRDPELYTRWLEMAAFAPVMRAHSGGIPSEPIYWDAKTRDIVTRYVKLRYRFLPYNYSLDELNATTGRPLVLPLNYFEPGNKRLANVNDEYLWGKDILVAPVLVKGDTVKKVIFPKGKWINWWTNKAYSDSATVPAPLDKLPLFVRAGSFIPQACNLYNTEKYTGEQINVNYYPAAEHTSVSFNWYNDDGKDPSALKAGKYELVNFTSEFVKGKQQIKITPLHSYQAAGKRVSLCVPGGIRHLHFSRNEKYTSTYVNGNVFDQTASTIIDFKWDGKPLIISFN